jgi:hypothetical protein
MKRLHIIGKSKDNKRLFLARARDAKFGSFEITIGRKLLRLIEEAQAARGSKRAAAAAKVPPAQEPDLAGVRVIPTEPPAAEQETAPKVAARPETEQTPSPGPAERPSAERSGFPWEPAEQIDLPLGTDFDLGKPFPETTAAPESGAAPEAKPAPEAKAALEAKPAPDEAKPAPTGKSAAPAAPRPAPPDAVDQPSRREAWIHARQTRVEIPERSNLTPAEIQALIRAGRGVRTVARLAGTPLAWIRYLAEPIRQERQGVVDQLLRARQTRARLGPSSETVGESVYQNLRSRGIRSADRILEDGFTAHRSDDREWRVRLSFQHRGKRLTARWAFDTQTREVTPKNTLAAQLGWRRPRRADEMEGEPIRRRPSGPRTAPRRTTSGKPRKRAASRKSSSAPRKKPAATPAPRKTTAVVSRKTTAAARKRVSRTSQTARKLAGRGKTSARTRG